MTFALLLLACVNCAGGIPDTDSGAPAPPPNGEGLPWLSISPGLGHACGVRANGRVYCWGEGSDTGVWAIDPIIERIPDRSDLKAVSVPDGPNWDGQSACALTNENSAVCWGEGGNREFHGPYRSLALGDDDLLALRDDGRLDCYFLNSGEPCPYYDTLENVASFVAEYHFVTAVKTDGELSGSPHRSTDPVPTWPPGPWTRIARTGTGGWICGIREGGDLSCFIDEPFDGKGFEFPPQGAYAELCVPFEGGSGCALDHSGAPVCWGGDIAEYPRPSGPFVALTCATKTWCGLGDDGSATCWGACPMGICDLPP